jgi:hypothetical protein
MPSNVLPDNLMSGQRLRKGVIQVTKKHNLVLVVFQDPSSQSPPEFRLQGCMSRRELVDVQKVYFSPERRVSVRHSDLLASMKTTRRLRRRVLYSGAPN